MYYRANDFFGDFSILSNLSDICVTCDRFIGCKGRVFMDVYSKPQGVLRIKTIFAA